MVKRLNGFASLYDLILSCITPESSVSVFISFFTSRSRVFFAEQVFDFFVSKFVSKSKFALSTIHQLMITTLLLQRRATSQSDPLRRTRSPPRGSSEKRSKPLSFSLFTSLSRNADSSQEDTAQAQSQGRRSSSWQMRNLWKETRAASFRR
jgi:hypothetical protein